MSQRTEDGHSENARTGFVRIAYFCEDESISKLIRDYSLVEHVRTRVLPLDTISELSHVEEPFEGVVIVDITEKFDAASLLGAGVRKALSGCNVIVLCAHQEADYWQDMVLRQEIGDFHIVRPLSDPWGLKIKMWRAIESSAEKFRGAKAAGPDRPEPGQAEFQARPFSGKRALIIEDDIASAEVAEDLLVAEGFEAKRAKSVLDALRKFADESFDLILLDLMMPGVSGPAAVRAVRKKFARDETPLIVTTAYSERSLVKECLEEGADDYLIKPLSRKKLLPRVVSALGMEPEDDPPKGLDLP